MSVDPWTQTPIYTVAGIGPYTITHPYELDAIQPVVIVDDVWIILNPTEYTLDPTNSGAAGNLYLTPAIAATHAGRSLVISRVTPDQQGWLALRGEREAGLAAQLDRMVQSLQEIRAGLQGTLRIRDPLDPFDWADGTVPVRSGDRVISGPTAIEIIGAQGFATAAAASAVAAAASAAEALARALAEFRPRGNWGTGIYYTLSDVVYFAGSSYYALAPHFATVFATDLAGGKWFILAQQGAAGAGTGNMLNSENLSGLTDKLLAFATLGGKAVGRVDLLPFSLIDPSVIITAIETLEAYKIDNAIPTAKAVSDYVTSKTNSTIALIDIDVSAPTAAIALPNLAGWDEVEISAELTSTAGLIVRFSPNNGITVRSTNYDARVDDAVDTDVYSGGIKVARPSSAGTQRFTMRIKEMASAVHKTGASGDGFYVGGSRAYVSTGLYNVAEVCNALQITGGTISAGWVTVRGIRRVAVAGPVLTVPAAFITGDWTLADVPSSGGNTAALNILALPSDGGSPITALEYQIGSGTWTALVGLGTGPRNITVPPGVASSIKIRATNLIGVSANSDTKSVTPTIASSTPPVIANLAYDSALNQLTVDVTEAAYYPVTIYYVVQNTNTVLGGQATSDLVTAASPIVYGTMTITAPGITTISPNWAGMTTAANWYFKVAARNSSGAIVTNSLVYGPFDWDAAAPTLSSASPADGASAVAIGSSIVLTFNKPILFEVGNVIVEQEIAAVWSVAEAFDVVADLGTGDGKISVAGAVVTAKFTGNFVGSRHYAVKVEPGALANLSGINFAGIADRTTLDFTTAAAPSWAYDALKGTADSTGTASLAVTLSGITASQRLFAVLTVRDLRTITTPAGWTLEATFNGTDTNADTKILVYSKTAAGGETLVTFASSASGAMYATVMAFTGSGRLNQIAQTSFAYTDTVPSPAIAVDAGAYRISVFAANQEDVVITPPAGGTVLTNRGARDGHMIWLEGPLSAGTAAAKTATYNALHLYTACSIELEPF